MDALTKKELLAILRCAYSVRERDGLMILVGYSHGLRPSEVVAIRREDIVDGFLTVARLKGSSKTVQPLVSDGEPMLDEATRLFEFVRFLPKKQRVFPVTRRTFGRIFSAHAAAAGVASHLRHPHILKHTIAMQTIHSAGIENVRQYLGHKSISSTGAYLKVSDQDAASAVSRALKI